MPDFYDFIERLQFSEGIELTETMLQHIYHSIPAAMKIEKQKSNGDDHGTDYWVRRANGLPPISIDMKNRSLCPIQLGWGDDLCIETTSQYYGPNNGHWLENFRRKPGWTIDDKKRTDLVVYTWPHNKDLLGDQYVRFYILYFPHLCMAARHQWREWIKTYGERPTLNRNYLTLNTYVPRKVVAAAIRELTVGVIPIL